MAAVAATAVGGLPAHLVHKNGSKIATSEALAGADYIGLYFSAHWCPPCRGFTPDLSKWFTTNGAANKLQIVFVSSDRAESEFDEYFKEMSWDLAIPFDSPVRTKLGGTYKVSGIPSFIILDKDGKVVTSKGREKVIADPTATSFPWGAQGNVWSLLEKADKFVDKHGKSVDIKYLKSLDSFGLYFSAHWCPPCRGFTPELARWYEAQTGPGGKLHDKLDIIFVSSDKDEKQFNEYMESMPWKALPFADRTLKAQLSEHFEVSGIPTLVFVNKDGSTITNNGRSKISSDPTGFPWPPAPFCSIDEAVDSINDVATLVLFTDAATSAPAEEAAVKALEAVAAEYFVGGKPNDRIRFAIASSSSGATVQVRSFLGKGHQADKDGPTNIRATIIDIPNGCKALFQGGALKVPTQAELSQFVKEFLEGKHATQSLKS